MRSLLNHPFPLRRIAAAAAVLVALLAVSCYPQGGPRSAPAPSTKIAAQEKAVIGRGLLLASDGQAALPIVISPGASAPTRAVATELADLLRKITGATFDVSSGDGTTGIVVGTLAEFPDPSLAGALEMRNGYDGKEAYAIRTEGDRLRLIGATDLGASHAVFRFLEAIGCRWFFQAPEWQVLPSIPTLKVKLNETDRPALLARRIWYGWGFFEHGANDRVPRDYAAWARHNRMASSFTINCGHAWQTIIANNKAAFDQHPEYLALTDGKRQGEQLCVSNPAVRQLAVDYALAFLKANPAADMVSMECSDGGGQCECDECKKLGSISDRAFGLANDVAKAVAKSYPGKMVGLYAYNEHCEPPSFALEPNVYVQLTAGFITGRYSFDELMELWPQRCRNMGYYDYFSVWLWDWDKLPGGRAANVDYIRKQIPRYVSHGATSLDCESGDNWGPHGRGYYVAARLMWNPKADADALLDDFYAKAFGPGAAAMQRYYERFDPSSQPLMSEHLLALGFRDVDEAARLAADRPDVLARLDQIKQYLRYVHLRWLLEHEKDKVRQKELTLAILTHVYRTRYTYMNHWEAMRQDWTTRAAKDFAEPTWAFNDPTPNKPWAVETPYSHDETERAFQEGLAYFRPQEIEERTFSADLVPVRFADSPKGGTDDAYQGGLRYALYSRNGEPLTFELLCGSIAWYRNRADGHFSVTDPSGKVLNQGRLVLDGKYYGLEIRVPGPGLYYLTVDDTATGWGIRAAADRPVAICLERGRGFSHMGWMRHPAYFYVPKGTREIQYYWSGGAHKVFGPDGKLVRAVESSGAFVKIPVPVGADGKPWSFHEFAPGHLWFFNLPNYLAASPDALLVPREVAVRDGLAP